jgi:hypothetical protein
VAAHDFSFGCSAADLGRRAALLAFLLAVLPLGAVAAGEAAKAGESTRTDGASAPAAPSQRSVSPFRSTRVTEKAHAQYLGLWGVDRLRVASTNAGNLIRFSYRVVDPGRAKVLGDRGATPYLYGTKSRAMLQVPVMDKVGPLRQSTSPQAGQEYWMVFSNKGNLVRPGDRVDVRIGMFHADGLMVE